MQEYERKRREFRAVEMRGILERNMHPAGAAGGNISGGIACEKGGSTHVKKKTYPEGVFSCSRIIALSPLPKFRFVGNYSNYN